MSKDALAWIRGLRRNKLLTTWGKFREDLTERFGSSAFEDKLEELSRLQQTGTVAAYMAQFEKLLNEVEGQTEESLITFFIGGLKPDIKNQLKIARLLSLRKALATAKVYESNKSFKPWKNFTTTGKTEPLIKNPPGETGVPIVRRTLTIEERKERTVKGLCFNCEEQYFPGHRCKGKLFRLDTEQDCLMKVINMEADAVEVNANEDIEISLHALSGSYNPRTIRMTGAIRGQQLTMLIDRFYTRISCTQVGDSTSRVTGVPRVHRQRRLLNLS